MRVQGLTIKKDKATKEYNLGSLSRIVNKDILGKKMNNKKKEIFYLELSSMLQAGMDIKDSLDVFVSQQTKPDEKKLFENIITDLVSGHSFSESLKRSNQFTTYEFYSMQIGEESGKLTEVLVQLANYYSERVKIVRQIIKSISYPLVILLSSLIATGFMITFIVPMFSNIFKRFGSDLPMLTKAFIYISDSLKANIAIILIVIFVVVVAFSFFWKEPTFMRWRQIIVSKMPYLGNMITSIYLARFCSAMSLLISAKIPLVQAIGLVKKMIEFYPIQMSLEQIEKDLINGQQFHESLSKFKIYDSKMISLLKVGEEVNKIDIFFQKLHSYYSDEVDMKANVLNTFLEPLIIIFLGLTIGAMLIAMYLPMFKLSNSIG